MGTRAALAAALATVALVSGCGGSGQGAAPASYDFAPTRQCLVEEPGVSVDTKHLDDFVASTALGGAMSVRLPTGNFAHVSFGRDADEAARIERAYRRFANGPIPQDSLQREGNVVLLWNSAPNPDERQALVGCLKPGG